MMVCEFLHCSYSELAKRCPQLYDKLMIINYVQEKNNREKNAMPPTPPVPSTPRLPRKR